MGAQKQQPLPFSSLKMSKTHILPTTEAAANNHPWPWPWSTTVVAAPGGSTRLFSTTATVSSAGNDDDDRGRSRGMDYSSSSYNNSPAPISSSSISATPASDINNSNNNNNINDEPRLTHTDPETGRASMVSVTEKAITSRTATATASIWLPALAFDLLKHNKHKKGDVLTVAQIAGIQAAKQTSNLIPLCHPLLLTHIAVDLVLKENNNNNNTQSRGGSDMDDDDREHHHHHQVAVKDSRKQQENDDKDQKESSTPRDGWVLIESRVACKGNTGVEMEALTAASVAALTVFDMCKAVGKDMVIGEIKVQEKTGGKSGHYRHGQQGSQRRSHGI
ncbi:hypothetical protein DFQ26_002125 [Actinomortierella ambigua]|nr:hypothetical protein DFQ26_002125 [Actinomortierella ambigua]